MTTTPMDFNPLPGFDAPRCRRYLFDRSWCEDPRASEEPVAPGRPASDPKPEGWNGGPERRR